MFARKLVVATSTAVLGTSGLVLAAVPIVKSEETSNNPEETANSIKCRRTELPIYPNQITTVTRVKPKEVSEIEKLLIGPVSTVRTSVIGVLQQGKDASSKAMETISDTAENFNFIVAYLREEENEPQRIGAVAMGTVAGFIFGLRGGFIKKITYSLIGTGIMGSICFPEETSKYVNQGIQEGKLLSKIAYNFVYGVKPGDPQQELHFPEINIPKNFDELISLASSVGQSAKNAIMPPPKEKNASESKKE